MAHFGNWERAAPRDEMASCLHLLERRLVASYAAIVIPFDDRVIFVNLPNRAEFSSRHSEVAQSLDTISRIQFLVIGTWFDKRWLLRSD